jgi:hypothetical protein
MGSRIFTLDNVEREAIVCPAELATSIMRAYEGPVMLGFTIPVTLTPYYFVLSVNNPEIFIVYLLIVQFSLIPVNS